MNDIVGAILPPDGPRPYAVVVAAACEFSRTTIDTLHRETRDRGVLHAEPWSAAHLEDLLYEPQNSALLTRFFGIDPAIAPIKESLQNELEHNLAVLSTWKPYTDVDYLASEYERALRSTEFAMLPPVLQSKLRLAYAALSQANSISRGRPAPYQTFGRMAPQQAYEVHDVAPMIARAREAVDAALRALRA